MPRQIQSGRHEGVGNAVRKGFSQKDLTSAHRFTNFKFQISVETNLCPYSSHL
jgi:hypothetical protein